MVLPLKYGDPPRESDCVDVGEVKVPTKIDNTSDEHGGQTNMYSMYGEKIPVWAQVRQAIIVLREYEMPVSAKVAGVGRLLYHAEGWEVVE